MSIRLMSGVAVVLLASPLMQRAHGSIEPPPALRELSRVSLSVVAEVDIPAVRIAEQCIEKRVRQMLDGVAIKIDASSPVHLLVSVRGDVRGDCVALGVFMQLREPVQVQRGEGRVVRAVTWEADDVRLVSRDNASDIACSVASDLTSILGVGIYGAQRSHGE